MASKHIESVIRLAAAVVASSYDDKVAALLRVKFRECDGDLTRSVWSYDPLAVCVVAVV